MKTLASVPFALALSAAAFAQTQTLRGSVEDVRGTTNQFFLDCTTLRATSTVLNLNTIVSAEMIFEVVNVGTAAAPVLDIRSAVPTTKVFDMGNLRVGQSDRWEVNAPAGSLAFVAIDFTASTGYLPLGGFGTFLLSGGAATLASGVAGGANQFQFNFAVPATAAPLAGISITGQALVGTNGVWSLSNPDCKVIELP